MATVSWTTLSPLPAYLDEVTNNTLASRPASLDGMVLGLLPNWRPSAVQILKALGALLEQRYRLKSVVMEPQIVEAPTGAKFLDSMQGKLDDLATRVDIVITGSGD